MIDFRRAAGRRGQSRARRHAANAGRAGGGGGRQPDHGAARARGTRAGGPGPPSPGGRHLPGQAAHHQRALVAPGGCSTRSAGRTTRAPTGPAAPGGRGRDRVGMGGDRGGRGRERNRSRASRGSATACSRSARVLPSVSLRAALQLADGAPVWEIRRQRMVNGEPKVYETAVIPVALAPGLDRYRAELNGSLCDELLAERYGLEDQAEEQYLEVAARRRRRAAAAPAALEIAGGPAPRACPPTSTGRRSITTPRSTRPLKSASTYQAAPLADCSARPHRTAGASQPPRSVREKGKQAPPQRGGYPNNPQTTPMKEVSHGR